MELPIFLISARNNLPREAMDSGLVLTKLWMSVDECTRGSGTPWTYAKFDHQLECSSAYRTIASLGYKAAHPGEGTLKDKPYMSTKNKAGRVHILPSRRKHSTINSAQTLYSAGPQRAAAL